MVRIGRKKYSLSKKIKSKVKGAIKFIDDFEKTATDLAIENGYKYVVCGHIHQPRIVRKTNKKGTCLYLNSGDWIENLTALEYNDKRWELIRFPELDIKQINEPQLLTAITVLKRSKSK